MMIDWFVVLAPLAALPIVLLFVFIGCPVPPAIFGPLPIGLYLPEFKDVLEFESLEVHLQYTLDTGQSPPDLRGSIKLMSPEILLFALYSGGLVSLSDLVDLVGQPDGELDCRCTVTLFGAMFQPSPVDGSVFMSPNNADGAYFFLFRNEADFGLAGVVEPGVGFA